MESCHLPHQCHDCCRNRNLFLGPTSFLGSLGTWGQKLDNSGIQKMLDLIGETTLHLEPLVFLSSLIPEFFCPFCLTRKATGQLHTCLWGTDTTLTQVTVSPPEIPSSVLTVMPSSMSASTPHVKVTCFRKDAIISGDHPSLGSYAEPCMWDLLAVSPAQERVTCWRSQETWDLVTLTVTRCVVSGKSLTSLGSVFFIYKHDKSACLTDSMKRLLRINVVIPHLTNSYQADRL